jgi:putative hydrolase of the HAD superfamily
VIIGFDLDDTLYRELDYVESGFRAAAEELERVHGVPAAATISAIERSLAERGRGQQFDDALRAAGLYSVALRDRLISAYRRHVPKLTLAEDADRVLDALRQRGHRLFLVTDGHHRVQAAKAAALGLTGRFEHLYFTNRYGRDAAKPSTRVFELMLRRTRSRPADLVYVGDNPAKDFVGVRRLGGRTIRVLTGNHASGIPEPGFEADVDVATLGDVVDVIDRWTEADVNRVPR